MPTSTWKHDERLVASFFAATRTPLSGENSRHATHSDTLSDYFYVETKRRKSHAAVQLYMQELPKAQAEGKPLVIALKQHRQQNPSWLMVIDPKDIHRISALLKIARRSKPCLWKRKKSHPTILRK